jgi:PAT family beta-lactamase induction signal transducer AmpG
VVLAGHLEVSTGGKIAYAWSVTFLVMAALFVLLVVYHKLILPRPASDASVRAADPLREFFAVFAGFFRKGGIGAILAFLLLYRLGESQLIKLVSPFLLDPQTMGGLGLSTSEVGIAYGTVGIVALLLGGVLGGYVISRKGLRYWLWPMVICIHLPDLVFVYLSQTQPSSFPLICAAVSVEQFGYGFGFTAYTLFMILVSEGNHKTAHFALCTGFMALGMMLPGMASGAIQEWLGYRNFFLWVILCTVPGFIAAARVKIPPGFGAKKPAPSEASA